MLEIQINYLTDCIKKAVSFGLRSLDVRQSSLDDFLASIQENEKRCVFTQNKCNSWYLSDFKGYNATLWPNGLYYYWFKALKCDPNDYEWK